MRVTDTEVERREIILVLVWHISHIYQLLVGKLSKFAMSLWTRRLRNAERLGISQNTPESVKITMHCSLLVFSNVSFKMILQTETKRKTKEAAIIWRNQITNRYHKSHESKSIFKTFKIKNRNHSSNHLGKKQFGFLTLFLINFV